MRISDKLVCFPANLLYNSVRICHAYTKYLK